MLANLANSMQCVNQATLTRNLVGATNMETIAVPVILYRFILILLVSSLVLNLYHYISGVMITEKYNILVDRLNKLGITIKEEKE